ncbi:MAG: metallophosphoesterase [Clostridiales bacterium]|jgi:predicted MPP superfamily phosphohydrolase|nr:metallophosphoesterase [Clostridiales bacterium]
MLTTKRKKLNLLLSVFAGSLSFLIFTKIALWDGLAVRFYTETTHKVTSAVRLAVIADLHSSLFGENQSVLAAAIRERRPDALLFVGDMTHGPEPDYRCAMLLDAVAGEYPCFFVSGNHEYWSGRCDEIKDMVRSYGVCVLEGEGKKEKINGQEIYLAGVDDPVMSASLGLWEDDIYDDWLLQLNRCKNTESDVYSVLLSHRPELVSFYENSGFDLVVSGHAHGGQVRIPFLINGLYSPNQGYFPKYAGGRYVFGDTTMIVSRGLCVNNLPRVFNRPEIVIVDIVPESSR